MTCSASLHPGKSGSSGRAWSATWARPGSSGPGCSSPGKRKGMSGDRLSGTRRPGLPAPCHENAGETPAHPGKKRASKDPNQTLFTRASEARPNTELELLKVILRPRIQVCRVDEAQRCAEHRQQDTQLHSGRGAQI